MGFDLQKSRNVYLNTFHLKNKGIDLAKLSEENEQTGAILSGIFSNPEFSGIIRELETNAAVLRNLNFESRNIDRLSGARTLKLGFPLFVFSKAIKNEEGETTGHDTISAPLFLVDVKIQPLQAHDESWEISKDGGQQVVANPFLEKYFQTTFDGDIKALSGISTLKNVQLNTIKGFVTEFSKKAGLAIPSLYQVFEMPDEAEMQTDFPKGRIQWSGVLGIFPELIATDFHENEEAPAHLAKAEFSREGKHPFPMKVMSPYQQTAFFGALDHQSHLVTGGGNTGKSRIVLNLLMNALSNGEKCLVVSNRVSVLNKLQNNLAQTLNAPLHFSIKNKESEKPQLLAMLRACAQSKIKPAFAENDWKYLLERTKREKNKLDRHYHAVNKPIFGIYNWTDTVGMYLENNDLEGKEQLNTQLKSNEFELTYKEFAQLDPNIERCQATFEGVNSLNHPLINLHEGLFLYQDELDSRRYLEKELTYFKKKGDLLLESFMSKTEDYRTSLQNHFESRHAALNEELESLENFMTDSDNKFGKSFSMSFFEWIGFKSFFSKKNKAIYEARKELVKRYQNLKANFDATAPFESEFEQEIDLREVPQMVEKLGALRADLDTYRDQINYLVQEEYVRLTKRAVHPALKETHGESIENLEMKLDYFTDELNNAKIFQDRFDNKTLTLPKRQQYLQSIIETIDLTNKQLTDYGTFHAWQANWLSLPLSGKKVVKSLIMVKPKNWQAAFRSWYIFNFLNKHKSPDLPQNDIVLEQYVEDFQAFKTMIPAKANSIWAEKKSKAISQIKTQNKELYQYFDGKNEPTFLGKSLEQIVGTSAASITDLVPVIFATPQAAFSFLSENDEPIFDRVIFEEASLLDATKALKISRLAKQHLILGDLNSVEADLSKSLLNWAIENKLPHTQLSAKHGPHLEELSAFITAASPTDGVVLGKLELANSQNLLVQEVNGRFSESAQTNEEEATHILHILNQIEQTPQRTYPSVGIACFTREQRNLILHQIQDIKKRNASGVDTIQHLERNGLGVFYVGNMSAEQFDIVITSLTFSAKNTKGAVNPEMDFLNTEAGLRKLYTLSTCGLQQIIFVHSIPEKILQKFRDDREQTGLFRLANFIDYGKAVMESDSAKANAILKKVCENPTEAAHVPESIFNNQIARIMQPYLENGRIGQNLQWSKTNIPVYTTSKEGNLQTFIEADGFISHAPHTSYVWEHEQRQKIQSGSIKFKPAWSVLWWKSAGDEARKLASEILKLDKAGTEV